VKQRNWNYKNWKTRIQEKSYPFDIKDFVLHNESLINKFLKKRTDTYNIEDFDDVPDSWLYKNNKSILSSRANRDFSTTQKLEWVKCSLNSVYFAKKYIKIISIDEGIIPFKMYDYQEDMIDLFQNNRFSIACTGRQQGKTTTAAAYILWFSTFHPSKESAVLANKADQAQEIMERIQLSYELLPCFMKQSVRTYNKRSMVFDNGSKNFSGASSTSSVRGRSIALLYWDEAAHTPNDIDFYESVFPTLSSGQKSKLIMTSTPNGTRGLFYKIWTEHEKNGFARIKVTWDMIPSRGQKWKEEMIAASSDAQFRQEHCAEFRGSSNSLLSGNTLERLVSIDPIQQIEDLRVFKEVQEDHMYVMTVDCSEGVNGDYHAVTVIDIFQEPYEVAATYKNNKLSPLLLPNLLLNIGTNYNDAIILIENASSGSQVASDLYYDLEYENTMMTVTEKGKQVLGFSANGRLGIKPSKQVKAIGCSTIKTIVEDGKINLNDQNIIDEFSNFIPKGGSYQAAPGAHDDQVMTLVLFGWLTTQSFFIDMTDVDIRKKLFSDMLDRSSDDMVPFGIISSVEFGDFDGGIHAHKDSLGSSYD
jgi:hypothetical protein